MKDSMTRTSQLGNRPADWRSVNRFAPYAWLVLVYNIGVVVWGAYVRATGSGAGCGNHWPLCNGEVIPQSPDTAMLIEFSHRVTSGLTLLFVAGLIVWAFRAYPKGSAVRLGAALTVFFTITEALVGAGLVLFQLVAENASALRAFSVAVHLTNTFLLLAALALTAFWASGGQPLRWRARDAVDWLLGIGLFGVLVLGVTGAITALGDTLFPPSSLAQGLQQDFSPTAQFLIRLRVFHPLIAVAVGVYAILLARVLRSAYSDASVHRLATGLTALVIVQWIAGIVNLYLLAPVWLQLVHLLLADGLWIAWVLLSASVLNQPVSERANDWSLKSVLRAMVSPSSKA
jgi:heme A synthase